MKREYANEQEATEVLKEALWLAWVAAGRPQGMGVFRDNPGANKEAVWDQAYNMKDYSGRPSSLRNDLNADYVFGRMLKLSVQRDNATTLQYSDSEPRADYQSWCGKYKTYDALFDAAEQSIATPLPKKAQG